MFDSKKNSGGEGDLNWRFLLLGGFICAVATAAAPYVTLKLGMGVDLSYGGMFLAAAMLGRYAINSKQLAVQLNILQAMINMVTGIGFMVVILAAFFYIQNVFGRDINFHPKWWQMFLWLTTSAVLGVFMGIWPRRAILNDRTLPWPTAKAVLSVAQTLTDPEATEIVKQRRNVLTMSTATAGFLTFLRDGLGVITPMVGNDALKMVFGLEFAALGLGMLIPLSVGLSGLLGVWFINTFGETVARLSALAGTTPENLDLCRDMIAGGKVTNILKSMIGEGAINDFLATNCGKATEYLATPSHFKFLVQWMMWPATAMMIAAALTSIIIPVVQNLLNHSKSTTNGTNEESMADEYIPLWWTLTGIAIPAVLIIWMTSAWFKIPWQEVLLAVAIQPILIIAGLRVLGITGSGPVSLMANATQFLFGLIWPAQIRGNLAAAYVSANPQAASEQALPAFWVARRLGGHFKTLVIAMVVVIPIGAILTPLMFDLLEKTYGIGLGQGQLSAPTGLKIASLALVMEKGLSALPYGAMTASVIAIFIGVLFELLLAIYKRDKNNKVITDADGNQKQLFWWVPIPSAFGFALILPPSLTLGLAAGSVISAVWHKFSTTEKGSYGLFGAPLAAGLVAGEAIVGAILLPVLGVLIELLKPYL